MTPCKFSSASRTILKRNLIIKKVIYIIYITSVNLYTIVFIM